MAIQHRRGNESDFVAGKMLPGELAVTTDGSKKAWIAFGAGDVKEFAFQDDIPLKISELENDEEFIKNTVTDLKNYYLKSETYTQEEINQLISVLPKYSVVVVDSLPLVGDLEKIYLLKAGDEEGNLFDEYIYVNSKWERIGSQRIDLSNYVTKQEAEKLSNDVNTQVTELKGDLDNLKNGEQLLCSIDNYEIGGLSTSGEEFTSTTRVRSIDTTFYDRDVRIVNDGGLTLRLFIYNADGTFNQMVNGVKTGYIIKKGTIFKTTFFREPEENVSSIYDYAKTVRVATEIDARLSGLEECVADLKNIAQENILTLSVETNQSVTEVDINPKSQYVIYPKRINGRDLKVYAYDGAEYKQVTFTNLKSGNRTDTVYFIGKYLINDTYGCTKLKFVSERGSYSNYMVLDLIEYPYTPYVRDSKYEPKLIPDHTQKNVIKITNAFGISNNDIYYREGNTINKYNIESGVKTLVFTATGNVYSPMIFENGNIIFIDGSDHKMYLLKDSNAIEKHTFYNSEYNVSLEPNVAFSLHCYGDIGIVCEYNSSKEPISGYKAYITKDSGETWSTLFDLENLVENPSDRNYHLHSVVYDEYQDMYWACNGDAGNVDMIWYSLDGVKWNKTSNFCSIKPTEIVPTKDYVLFLSDLNLTCVYKWNRDKLIDGDTITLDMVKVFEMNWKGACPIGTKAFYDRTTDVVYFGFATDSTINEGFDGDLLKYCDVFATDGYKVIDVYKSDVIERFNGAFGNDKYIVISKPTEVVVISK